jgi:hypothetical protein
MAVGPANRCALGICAIDWAADCLNNVIRFSSARAGRPTVAGHITTAVRLAPRRQTRFGGARRKRWHGVLLTAFQRQPRNRAAHTVDGKCRTTFMTLHLPSPSMTRFARLGFNRDGNWPTPSRSDAVPWQWLLRRPANMKAIGLAKSLSAGSELRCWQNVRIGR